jgi:hypothetical protein
VKKAHIFYSEYQGNILQNDLVYPLYYLQTYILVPSSREDGSQQRSSLNFNRLECVTLWANEEEKGELVFDKETIVNSFSAFSLAIPQERYTVPSHLKILSKNRKPYIGLMSNVNCGLRYFVLDLLARRCHFPPVATVWIFDNLLYCLNYSFIIRLH